MNTTILITTDSYFTPKKAAEIPKKDPIIRAKMTESTPTPRLTRKPENIAETITLQAPSEPRQT